MRSLRIQTSRARGQSRPLTSMSWRRDNAGMKRTIQQPDSSQQNSSKTINHERQGSQHDKRERERERERERKERKEEGRKKRKREQRKEKEREREKDKGLGKEYKDVGEMRSMEKENRRSRYSSRWMPK